MFHLQQELHLVASTVGICASCESPSFFCLSGLFLTKRQNEDFVVLGAVDICTSPLARSFTLDSMGCICASSSAGTSFSGVVGVSAGC